MAYQTVFETGLTRCPLWFPAFGLIFLAIGLALLKWHQDLQTVALGGVAGECYRCVRSLSRGAAQVVEGKVTGFTPMSRTSERFTVNGVEFSYSDYTVTRGFDNTASRGGPIREGLQVRIHYVDQLILRLEVAR